MKLMKFNVLTAIVICIMLSSSAKCGRTIKKPGVVLTQPKTPQPTITADDYETEDIESSSKIKIVQDTVSEDVSNEMQLNSTKAEQKVEHPQMKKRKKPCNHTASSQVPLQYRYPPSAYHYRLPPTMYQTYYKNPYRKQTVPSYGLSQSVLPHLQKAAVDIARGILSGMGWDTENWRVKIAENVVKLIPQEMLSLLKLFV